jgi:hypothetical protein
MVKISMVGSFPLLILATRLQFLAGLVVVAILVIPYFLWAHVKSRNMQVSQEKLTFKENTLNMARELSWIGLWLLELSAIGFVLAGVFILITDLKNWMIALASILFFGLAAAIFGKMIAVKRKQSVVV